MIRLPTFTASLALAMAVPASASAQQPVSGPVRLVEVAPTASAPFGERFDLILTLRVAPGVSLLLPDSLPASPAVEGSGRAVLGGRSDAPGDSIDVDIAYPAIAFLEGRVALAELPVFVASAAGGADSDDLIRVDGRASPPLGAARVRLRLGALLVSPIAAMDEGDEPAVPRPAADVLGPSWGPWDLIVVLALISGAAGFAALRARRDRGFDTNRLSRPRGLARPEALGELDRIIGLGWHREGRLAEFYTATTSVLRRRLFREEPDWGPWLTSREVTRRLVDRWGGDDANEVRRAVHASERIRFSEHGTSPSAAERDWAIIRDWIAGAPSGGESGDADEGGRPVREAATTPEPHGEDAADHERAADR